MELLIDATTDYETLSFMDGYSGFNHMKMHPDDVMKAFRSLKGVFCYKVMPFNLNNVEATHQRPRQ